MNELAETPARDARIRLSEAWRALRALGGPDPAAAASAFLFATRGNSGARSFARFRASANGARLLAARPVLVERLAEPALEHLAPTTLGGAWRDFMRREKLHFEDFVRLPPLYGGAGFGADELWFARRAHLLHDLRHVLLGYGPDALGEVCLMTFRFAQIGHVGMGLLAAAALPTLRRRWPGAPVARAVWQAYRDGRRADWMEDIGWEDLIGEDLTDLRRRFNIAEPLRYQAIIANGRQRSRSPASPPAQSSSGEAARS